MIHWPKIHVPLCRACGTYIVACSAFTDAGEARKRLASEHAPACRAKAAPPRGKRAALVVSYVLGARHVAARLRRGMR